jgi:DMSO/TMAO reductase YedYZ molybdopterin-dependent catalytic subunit
MPRQPALPPLTGPAAEAHLRRLTRRGFLTAAATTAAGLAAWRWLSTAAGDEDLPWPLRRMLRFNQAACEMFLPPRRLAPTFADEAVQGRPRLNGLVGLQGNVPDKWRLRIQHEGQGVEQAIGLDALRALPRVDLVTELKCVEGWSQVMHFGGVRLADFIERFGATAPPAGRANANPADSYRYVYVATPDEGYYVGLDMASAMHPQTILCDTMNWEPINRQHGAPLRLYLAVKYGFKSLKRVGLIRLTNQRPADYWGERGYDWYAGL